MSWTSNAQGFSAVLAILLALIATYDFRFMKIPDTFNGALFLVGMCGVYFQGWMSVSWALVSAIVGGSIVWLVRQIYFELRDRQGLGLGDVKFFAAAGPWIGLERLPTLMLYGSMSALIGAFVLYVARGTIAATDRLAFGPFLALALWIVWVFGAL